MASNNQTPFSLRPWPTRDKRPKNLAEFIARVNQEPGGFRKLNETELRQRIQERQQPKQQDKQEILEDDGMDISEGEDDDDEGEEAKGKTALVAREEFLKNIDFAHQSAMLALDSISLLLSKEAPVQAGTTLSPTLRELVGIGTLGASKLKEPNVTEDQIRNDLSVATGWRVMGINNMVDSVLAAAERLEKEIELETKYWADVLAVSDDGWTVCALPQEPYTLGVRFGFSESAPEFRNSSIAPLIRNDDGTIKLGVGKIGGGAQRIRITVKNKKSGMVTDQSPLPGRIPDDAPLKDRVREARNTIFHQELWYELNREARFLLSYGVHYDGPAIIWRQGQETEFMFTIEDLEEQDDTNANLSEGIRSSTAAYSFLQFLLFQSHRQNYHKRTSLSSLVRQTDSSNSTYNILRSFISRFEYFKDSADFDRHLDKLVHVLRYAGISTSFYSVLPPSTPQPPGAPQVRHTPTTELLWVQQLVYNLVSIYTFTITPDVRIWCYSRGFVRPSFIGTHFYVSLKQPFADNKDQPPSPLEATYPPADYYPTVQEAVCYICQATVRVLAQKVARTTAEKLADNDIQWSETIWGIRVTSNKGRIARIDAEVVDSKVVLTLKGNWADGKTRHSHTWTWTSDGQNAEGQSIEDVVLRLMRGDV
ncbi:subunit 17 of mediator complex-domain-containing protein [Xylaria longipes]|nr:subunit 17 of mediator complex-domain-containing protein [Xylaria longipes]